MLEAWGVPPGPTVPVRVIGSGGGGGNPAWESDNNIVQLSPIPNFARD